jgi:hypothetical protein
MVLRFPLWVMIQKLWMYIKIEKLLTSESIARSECMIMAQKKREKIGKKEQQNINLVMELCFYSFIEGIDAFYLMDDIIEHGYYFATNQHITIIVLVCISVNLLLVNFNYLAATPIDHSTVKYTTKMMFVIFSNLPFLAIRLYLFVDGGFPGYTTTTGVYVLFIIKEASMSLIAAIEACIDCHWNRKVNCYDRDEEVWIHHCTAA